MEQEPLSMNFLSSLSKRVEGGILEFGYEI